MRSGYMTKPSLFFALSVLLPCPVWSAAPQHPVSPSGAPQASVLKQREASVKQPDARTGTLSGVITYAGPIPDAGTIQPNSDVKFCGKHVIKKKTLLVDRATMGLKNVVVEIKGKSSRYRGKKIWALDQRGCVFIPHVLTVPQGAVIEIKNSDAVLHNVRVRSKLNRSFNLAIPAGKSVKKKFHRREKIKVLCDVHPWMHSWIVVCKSRFYALTDDKGAFRIEGIPPGDYEVQLWHETLGKAKAKVDIRAGQPSTLRFVLKATKATAVKGRARSTGKR